jgi:hypothetical protein
MNRFLSMLGKNMEIPSILYASNGHRIKMLCMLSCEMPQVTCICPVNLYVLVGLS